jgi:hypothetical protein
MSEAEQGRARAEAHRGIDSFLDGLRRGLHELCDALTPSASAANHFREARLEVLRGMREIIDSRIERVSRPRNKGTRVPVD